MQTYYANFQGPGDTCATKFRVLKFCLVNTYMKSILLLTIFFIEHETTWQQSEIYIQLEG